MKTLGERIADLRRERGITQENLAGIIGVSAQAISKWENNATMPDIMLLPIIADTLGVTIDELFGIRRKVQEKPLNCEETPKAVYDQILNTMWRSGDNNDFAERAKAQFAKNPYEHSGFVSEVAGAAYANKDIALTYLPSDKESLKLLENEDAAELLKMLSDKNVRLVLAYQFENPEKAFTASSAAAKVGISEEEAKAALEKLFDCIQCPNKAPASSLLYQMKMSYQAYHDSLFISDLVLKNTEAGEKVSKQENSEYTQYPFVFTKLSENLKKEVSGK